MQRDTILILGGDADEHAVTMLGVLRERGQDVELLDTRWFPTQMMLTLAPNGDGALRLPHGRLLQFAAIKSVYWRNYNGVAPPLLTDEDASYIAQNDSRGLMESLLISLNTRWVNGWQAYQLHQTKPVQLARVAALGVKVPATLWTNDRAELLRFVEVQDDLIFKPVQGGDETRRLTEEHLSDDNLASLAASPITVQALVPGTNVRVFVAGERVMACEVKTPELDYRQDAHAALHVHALPAAIEQQSRTIARALELLWTGIDYRLTPAGEYVFLEANPSPMFLGFEAQTGLPLTESLAALLIRSH